MSDEKLRALAREASTGDPVARYRHRCELVRLGRGVEVGFEIGDVVLVEERWMPWRIVPWFGVVTGLDRGRVVSAFPLGVKGVPFSPRGYTLAPFAFTKAVYQSECDRSSLVDPYLKGSPIDVPQDVRDYVELRRAEKDAPSSAQALSS